MEVSSFRRSILAKLSSPKSVFVVWAGIPLKNTVSNTTVSPTCRGHVERMGCVLIYLFVCKRFNHSFSASSRSSPYSTCTKSSLFIAITTTTRMSIRYCNTFISVSSELFVQFATLLLRQTNVLPARYLYLYIIQEIPQ
jgi:hypothetical protein